MSKRGLLKILIGILLVIVIATISAGIYLYYFHTFKTIRVCLSETGRDTNLTCETNDDCVEIVRAFSQEIDEDTPEIMKYNFERILNESMYCNATCYVRETRGFNPASQDLEFLDSCNDSEIEIAVDIKGKDAVQIFNWLKE